MAKTRFIQSAFTSGVLSPLILGRIDINQYYNGLEVGREVVLLPQGGLKRRQGMKYIESALPVMERNTTLPTMPNGGTAANINDGNDSTITTTTTNISTIDPYVVAQYDLGADTEIEYCDIRVMSLSVSGTSNDFVVQTSLNGADWTTAATVPTVGIASQNFRLRLQANARYYRLAKIGATDLTTNRVNLSEFNLSSKTSTLSEVKLKDFSISTDEHYLFVFTDGNCRIYDKSDDSYKADIKVPFTSAQVKDIRDVQSEKVILLFHQEHLTVRITNLGTSIDWFQDVAPYINVPKFDYDDDLSPTPVSEVQDITFNTFTAGQRFQIDVEGIISKNISFAGDSTADERSATAENIRKNLQDMPKFGATGISVAWTSGSTFRITISGESADAYELFSGYPTSGEAADSVTFTKVATGSPRKEDVWSSNRGWPKTACFYEGRLIIGGTKSKPQSVFCSKSGSAFDFEIDEGDDDDAIFATISSRELSEIVDVFPGRNLQIFTAGSEFAALQSPITPQTFGVIPQTSHGSLNLEAKEIDGATLIIDRNGKTLREYLYSFNEDAYVANDISVLSPELIEQPVDLTILGGTRSDDANWVFITNQDGTMTVLNTLRSQDINGFTTLSTDGEITDASTVDDEVYLSVKREVNGSNVYYIERLSFDFYMDSAISVINGSPTDVVTGLEHLEGKTVRVRADDADEGEFTVSGGQITLTAEKTNVQVGLPFTPTFKQMPIATNIGSGINQNRIKKIVRMNIRSYETAGLYIDGQPTPVRQFGDSNDSPLDTPPLQRTGIIDDFYPDGGWEREYMPTISQPDPMPFTILNIEYEIESS